MKTISYGYVWLKKYFFRLLAPLLYKDKKERKRYLKAWTTKAEKQYLSRYLYVLRGDYDIPPAKCAGHKIWVCWLQGEEKAPEVVKKCLDSIRRYKGKYEVVVVDDKNISQYADIPDYIYDKWKKGCIMNTQFSDLLRLALLTQNGGIWIDATVFLTQELPEEISEADFFAFHCRSYLKSNNWFLKAERENPLLNNMRRLMFEYWRCENHMLNYFLYHLFFDLMTESDIKSKALWDEVPVMYDDVCYGLEHNFFTPYDEALWQKLQTETTIHKLTYKYDKNKEIKGTFLEKFLNDSLPEIRGGKYNENS